MAKSFSREKLGKHRRRRNKVDEKSCVTPAGTSNDFDVQNKLGRKHTHTTLLLLV